MKEANKNKEEREKLKFENELKKAKMKIERGANFFSPPGGSKLPPEVENQWLNNIEQFETAWDKSKSIKVYDFIGKPEYKTLDDIPADDIEKELERVMKCLNRNGIALDTICDVENRELYRFITEELFQEEIDDMRIEGMTTNFIYEEFHPNHEYDIKSHCGDFLNALLNKEHEFNCEFLPLTKEIEINAIPTGHKELTRRMELFRSSFDSFDLHHFNITSLKIKNKYAEVDFDIEYSGIIEGTRKKESITGKGAFSLKLEYDYWCICKMNIPGVMG